jgi:Protein of unknown function (DUF1552)
MSRFRLNRRSFLRGAGSIAIALPWLELMHDERAAKAGAAPARRFLAVYTPGGTVHEDPSSAEKWTPTGTETDFTLSPILAPLAPVQKQLIVPSGVAMKSANGEQQQAGMVALLTGTRQVLMNTGALGYAAGPSIDQVLAKTISAGKARASLQLAVRWGTGKAFGQVSPIDIVNFAEDAAFSPVPPQIDPVAIWTNLFGNATPDAPKNWDKSILDYVDRRYTALAARIGTADKQRIEEHLSRVRGLEKDLASLAIVRCNSPVLIDTADYDPNAGMVLANSSTAVDPVTDAAIPKVGKFMLDMLVMAFACDLTAVGTMMWSDCQARHTFPWLNLNQTYNFYQNDGGYWPAQCQAIGTWYAQQHSYLLQQMAAIDLGSHSLLDESVVFFGSEVSNPATHQKNDMPFLLAGGGGGLKTGRWLRYANAPSHNDLLVSLFNLFGDARTTFGDPAFCTGPLSNLI